MRWREKYGTWVEKSMYGRKYMGMERSTFLVDKAGKIARGLAQGQRHGPRSGGAGGSTGADIGRLGAGDLG